MVVIYINYLFLVGHLWINCNILPVCICIYKQAYGTYFVETLILFLYHNIFIVWEDILHLNLCVIMCNLCVAFDK